MMLWFALLLLLIKAPGSEARLLPEDQLRAAKGLGPFSGADATPGFVSTTGTDRHFNPSLFYAKLSGGTPSTPSGGNNLIVVGAEDETLKEFRARRTPPASDSDYWSLVSSSTSGTPTVPIATSLQSSLLTSLRGGTPSSPSTGNNLIVRQDHPSWERVRSPPIESNADLGTSTTVSKEQGDDSLDLEQKTRMQRSPPARNSGDDTPIAKSAADGAYDSIDSDSKSKKMVDCALDSTVDSFFGSVSQQFSNALPRMISTVLHT